MKPFRAGLPVERATPFVRITRQFLPGKKNRAAEEIIHQIECNLAEH